MAIDLDALDAGLLPNKVYATVDGERATLDRLARGHGDGTTATRQVASDLFIDVRPKADLLVYVLIAQLDRLDAQAGDAARTWYERKRETLTVQQGSDWINRLRAKIATYNGVAAVEPKADLWAEWRKVAGELCALGGQHGAGFAVDTEQGATNSIAFWRIVPDRNREGRFYLRQVLGGSGAVRVRIGVEAMLAVAAKIAVDPRAAMMRYGQELGECGHCYRTLTNDESRALGIGPRCRASKGW